MRNPQVGLSVRVMMAAVAVVALGLWLYQECQDGLPPRFVARRVPGRMMLLRPGMEYDRARETLGFDRHWLVGGVATLSSRHEPIVPDVITETYEIQPGFSVENMQADDRSPNAYVILSFRKDAAGPWRLIRAEYTDQKLKRIQPIP
jgi:hypothetical protein